MKELTIMELMDICKQTNAKKFIFSSDIQDGSLYLSPITADISFDSISVVDGKCAVCFGLGNKKDALRISSITKINLCNNTIIGRKIMFTCNTVAGGHVSVSVLVQ